MAAESGHRTVDGYRAVDAGSDTKSQEEARLVGLVFRTRRIGRRPQHRATDGVGVIGCAKPTLAHGCGDRGELAFRGVIDCAGKHNVAGVPDRICHRLAGWLSPLHLPPGYLTDDDA